jgi:hypothetical protein
VNNEFLSFKGADVYKHNVGSYNNFYGTLGQSTFAFNFNEEPSTRKIFKNISIEGNSAWNVEVSTDMQNGYAYSSDFLNKENVYYSYIRGLDSLDLKTLSVTGLGVIQNIIGSDYFLSEVPSSVSVGDKIYNTNRNLFGTVSGIGPDYISITPEPFITFIVNIGDFILSSKPSSIETSGIRGYYMNTRFNLQTTGYAEVYAINSEVAKSFE